ncbi:MAG: hypothetical protein JNL98_28345 [Bryobacterales bacterium]|nr:hypothetical protein [Bryobacterales bacterium]
MTNAMRDLLQTNRTWLGQMLDLLANTRDEHYSSSPAGLEPHRAGGHLRHILDFYECFLAGLARGSIDYDARQRDPNVESDRAAAIRKTQRMFSRLAEVENLEYDKRLWVKVEASEGLGLLGNFVLSTVGRELQVLSSHTVHHFALMAVTLRLLGADVPCDFGVAPSTLLHHARRSDGEMRGEAA